MNTINIKLYDFARTKLNLSETDAKEFVLTIDEVVVEDIKASISNYKSLWKEDFYSLDRKILESKGELLSKLEQSKSDMYKAMFVTGLVQFLAIMSGVLAIIKLTK